MRHIPFLLVVGTLIISITTGTKAGVIDSRAALHAGLAPGSVTEAFENIAVAPSSYVQLYVSYSFDSTTETTGHDYSTNRNHTYGPGMVVPGITIAGQGFHAPPFYWFGEDGSRGWTQRLAASTTSFGRPSRWPMIVDFTDSVELFGVDVIPTAVNQTAILEVYAADDVTLLYTTNIALFNSEQDWADAFFGYTDTDGIGKFTLNQTLPTDYYLPAIDNLTFGTVPEPGSLGILLLSATAALVRPKRRPIVTILRR